MALPGLLIEYLVVGSMALLWALPLAGVDITDQIPFGSAAALAPAIYVLGMFVDFIAYVLLTRFPFSRISLKSLLRKYSSESLGFELKESNVFLAPKRRNSYGLIWLSMRDSSLLKEISERSSRDRIARGAFVNILLMWLVAEFGAFSIVSNLNVYHWLGLSLFSLSVWGFLERSSYRFELRVGHEVSDMPSNN